jgi:hypothetical protein
MFFLFVSLFFLYLSFYGLWKNIAAENLTVEWRFAERQAAAMVSKGWEQASSPAPVRWNSFGECESVCIFATVHFEFIITLSSFLQNSASKDALSGLPGDALQT